MKKLLISPRAIRLAHRIRTKELRTVECGLHSGFPECCIAFFCHFCPQKNDDRWPKCYSDMAVKEMTDEAKKRSARKLLKMGVHPLDIRPGPACVIKGNYVRVKSCDCHKYKGIKLPKDWKKYIPLDLEKELTQTFSETEFSV